MTYIVEPKVFYWVQVLDSIKTVAVVCAVLGIMASACLWASYWVEYKEDDEKWLRGPRYGALAVSILGVAVAIFAPSRDTMIAMLVAKTATVENLGFTIDTLKEAVDYIVEAVARIKG